MCVSGGQSRMILSVVYTYFDSLGRGVPFTNRREYILYM